MRSTVRQKTDNVRDTASYISYVTVSPSILLGEEISESLAVTFSSFRMSGVRGYLMQSVFKQLYP